MLKKSKAIIIVTMFFGMATSSFADISTNSDAFAKQLAPHVVESDGVIVGKRKDDHKGLTISTAQMFSFDFSNWNPNSLHWNPPSNLLINSDGSWYMYAKHIANMRRTGGIFDTGRRYTFLANVSYFSGWDTTNERCVGTVLHSKDYVLISLDYKQERWDVSARGTDNRIPEIRSRVQCASVTRWIR